MKSTIVEGFGRRRYKADFVKFLIYAQASKDETDDHLDTLYATRSLADSNSLYTIKQKLETLGKKISRFIEAVERSHQT